MSEALRETGTSSAEKAEQERKSSQSIYVRMLRFGLVWFLCLIAYQLFVGYLMPKPLSYKNSSGTI